MPRCLYCLRTDVSFCSEEHSIPQGLGNEEIVLPKGVVCDTCNHVILSPLDSVLVNFAPIKFQRSFHGIKSRSGNPITFKSSDLYMARRKENHVYLEATNDSKSVTSITDNGFTLNIKGDKKMTPEYTKLLARALYKIGLGLIYTNMGEEAAYSPRFDEVRKIILGKQGQFHGQLLFVKNPASLAISGVQHCDTKNDKGTLSLFKFYYFGIEIFFEMEQGIVDLPDDFPKTRIDVITF